MNNVTFHSVGPRSNSGSMRPVPDCAWCGGECDRPRPYVNWRGETFCSPAHRSASNRALRRLTGEGAPKGARRNPSPNDPYLTVEKLHLKKIIDGFYEYTNPATGTTWHISRVASAAWRFRDAESNREGGGTLHPSLAAAKVALVEYLRGRYHDTRFGWCTR